MEIQTLQVKDIESVVELSLQAWVPVFHAIKAEMNAEIYTAFYPDGWKVVQEASVRDACQHPDYESFVAIEQDQVVGFIVLKLDLSEKFGEIHMIAVDPAHQGKGIASQLTSFGLAHMQAAGISMVMVDTGGDTGHAPARKTYEKMGFHPLPITRYFRTL